MAQKIVDIERERRGFAILPSLTELAALHMLGTTSEVKAMFPTDQATSSELNRRINKVLG